MNINWGKAGLAGTAGTAVMTMVGLWAAPMMGRTLFSGSATLAGASLIEHLVYGAVVGSVYGLAAGQPAWQRTVA